MRLYLLQLALRPESGTPVPGYLIQTGQTGQTGQQNILIDSGFPASAGRTDGVPNKLGFTVRPEDNVVARLAEIGVRPNDVDIVIATHFDADHAGSHALFPHAEFIVQRRHLDFARTSGHPRVGPATAHWRNPNLRYREVEGDVELIPGVELIESGGHVPGHQSVLVRLPNTGPVLLAIDAIPTSAMADAEARGISVVDMDEAGTRASTRKLMEIARREHALVIFGHDGPQWAALKKSPAFYD